jgi:catechol 2,3-dioxygenase-like lactoylglutathione lyase family enzyme
MSTGKLSHLQVNVKQENLPFYKDLFTFLGWHPFYSGDVFDALNWAGVVSLCFWGGPTAAPNDPDGPGVNHLGLAAESQAAVDATVAYLGEHGIDCLFETPRHRPDFSQNETDTYYQVMFASPDGILFEHVYTGPRQG